MKRIAFIGSGELSQHIAHYIKTDTDYEIIGFFDDFAELNSTINSYKVIGRLDDIIPFYNQGIFDELVNGVGNTRMEYRKRVFEGFYTEVPFLTYIHSSCLVDVSASIGMGVILFPKVLLYYNSVIENNVFIQVGSTVTDSTVGNHTMISGNVIIAGRTTIGACCDFGISTTISNDLTLCDNVRTGAGTVIVKNINESGLYVGVPARKIK
jgi:sugar O-acyltransferase (sialic acid O-acetyltransferase NeuD family)